MSWYCVKEQSSHQKNSMVIFNEYRIAARNSWRMQNYKSLDCVTDPKEVVNYTVEFFELSQPPWEYRIT